MNINKEIKKNEKRKKNKEQRQMENEKWAKQKGKLK